MPNIVTISREFGSGGRELGKRLADELQFSYYDREIITAIAEKTGMNENYIEHAIENDVVNFKWHPLTFAKTFPQVSAISNTTVHLLSLQHNIVREIAQNGNCVIVGRAADSVLSGFKPFNIFVYADEKSKIERCRLRASPEEQEQNLSDSKLLKQMKQIDKNRAEYHDIISSSKWGDKSGYNICVNTTGIEIKNIVPILAEFCKNWFNTLESESEKQN